MYLHMYIGNNDKIFILMFTYMECYLFFSTTIITITTCADGNNEYNVRMKKTRQLFLLGQSAET